MNNTFYNLIRGRGIRQAFLGLLLMAVFAVAAFGFQDKAASSTPAGDLVNKYCVSCHNQKLKTANLMLDRADSEHVANSAEAWEKVIVKLRSRAMPPAGMPSAKTVFAAVRLRAQPSKFSSAALSVACASRR